MAALSPHGLCLGQIPEVKGGSERLRPFLHCVKDYMEPKCPAHEAPSINGRIVVNPIKSAPGPFGFCGLECHGWFTGRPGKSWAGLEQALRAAGLGKGPTSQAPHGQSILKALY